MPVVLIHRRSDRTLNPNFGSTIITTPVPPLGLKLGLDRVARDEHWRLLPALHLFFSEGYVPESYRLLKLIVASHS